MTKTNVSITVSASLPLQATIDGVGYPYYGISRSGSLALWDAPNDFTIISWHDPERAHAFENTRYNYGANLPHTRITTNHPTDTDTGGRLWNLL